MEMQCKTCVSEVTKTTVFLHLRIYRLFLSINIFVAAKFQRIPSVLKEMTPRNYFERLQMKLSIY